MTHTVRGSGASPPACRICGEGTDNGILPPDKGGAMEGISVFFPCYGDAGTIPSLVIRALQTVRTLTDDYEVIVINDASPDDAAEVLRELQRAYPDELRVITHTKNRDYGGVLRAGFAAATKPLIFYTDGDAQYDPRELALLAAALTPDADIINGYKIDRGDPLIRKVVGRVYHWGMKLAFGFKIRDVDCDFRLIRRRVFDKVELTSTSGSITVEFVAKATDLGFRFVEVPVHHYHRLVGKSQFFNFPRIFRTLRNLALLWWELRVRRSHLKGQTMRDLPAVAIAQPADD